MSETDTDVPLTDAPLGDEPVADQPEPRPPAVVVSRAKASALAILLGILVLGGWLRFTGLGWDGGTHLHPDERFLTIVASSLSRNKNPLDYLRTSVSTLNPYNAGQSFYVYGNFPMTATVYAAEWAAKVCDTMSQRAGERWCERVYTGYDGVHLVGRFLSALIDLAVVALTFLIGRRLYGRWAGLIAAFLLAVSVMPIQQAHFFTADTWATFFSVVAIYAAVRAAGIGEVEPRWRLRWYVVFGVALGLAVASRINMAPLALVINISALIWLGRRSRPNSSIFANRDFERAAVGVVLAAAVFVLTFRVAQPYAFNDAAMVRQAAVEKTGVEPGAFVVAIKSVITLNPQFLSNMSEIQRLQKPDALFPPALQWIDRPAILFPLSNMVLYGMGVTAGIFAWFALLWAAWRIFTSLHRWWRARFEPDAELVTPEWMLHAIPVFWTLLYFLYMGTRWVKSVRYFLPVYPTLFVLAGWALIFLWRRAKASDDSGRKPARVAWGRRAWVGALAVAVLLPSLLWAVTFTRIYRQPMTRVAASNWIFDHVPSGATLLYVSATGVPSEMNLPLKWAVLVDQGMPLTLDFTMPEGGLIQGVRFNYLDDPDFDIGETADDAETLRVRLNDDEPLDYSLALDGERQAVIVGLPPTSAQEGQPLRLTVEAGPGGPIRAGTSLLVNELWDDLLPASTNGRNAYGSYYSEVTGGQRPVTDPDSPQKREAMLQWLDEADYIMLSSQRAIWSQARNPLTYPLMIAYYRSLFDGSLGYELVAGFHEDTWLGPLYISDTTGQLSWGRMPNIGWPPPNELAAEEAFSVYDHPPVWIFRKTANYNAEAARALLERVDLNNVVVQNPLEATRAKGGLMLTAAERVVQQAGGTFREVFNLDGTVARHPWLAAVTWLAAMTLLGWAAFPLTFVALRGLPDRGYALSRVLGLLVISYLSWLAASVGALPFTRWTILLALFILLAASVVLAARQHRELSAFFRQRASYVALVELLGVALFMLMIGVRLGNPDVWDVIWGGEKPMDLSYFTAVMRSTTFPPYDPWLAGGYINYYYYGFVVVGVLAKLFGTMPAVAYNLALPMLYSMTGLGVFSLAWNLVTAVAPGDAPLAKAAPVEPIQPVEPDELTEPASRPPRRRPRVLDRAAAAGFVAVALALLLGNLAQVRTINTAWYRAGSESLESLPVIGRAARTLDGGVKIMTGTPAPIYTGDWFWTASRAIAAPGDVEPITEFPWFTFLYGDLHAHMISMPLQMLALGWAVGLVLLAEDGARRKRPISRGFYVAALLVGALAVGALRPTNTWDWPTYLLLGSLAALYHFWRVDGLTWRAAGRASFFLAGLAGLSSLAFLPFTARYGSAYSSASLWTGSHTGVADYLFVHGLFLFLAATWLAIEYRDWASWAAGRWPEGGFRQLLIMAGALTLALIAVALVRGYRAGLPALPVLVAAGLLTLRPSLPGGRRVVAALVAAAVGLTLVVEVVVLDGDIGRMNTVFKFYLQVWLMLSVAGGAALVWTWGAIRQTKRARSLWQAALAVLVFMAALYPLTATPAKWAIRMNKEAPHTLDGAAFLPYVEYGDTDYAGRSVIIRPGDDAGAIEWLQRNVDGSPVVMEAFGGNPYRSIAARVAMYTGLPSVVGWDWHQRQQRATTPGTIVTSRIDDVNRFYSAFDTAEARNILDKYGVEYIFVGTLENAYYWPEGLAKFDQMIADGVLREVYRDATARILQVTRAE